MRSEKRIAEYKELLSRIEKGEKVAEAIKDYSFTHGAYYKWLGTGKSICSKHIDRGLERCIKKAKKGVPMTYREIAEECGCSHQRIQQIEQKALRKLRSMLGRETCFSGQILREEA